MSIMRQRKLDEFASRTGIKPATGETAETLDSLSKTAYECIRVIELERSGIRDGDGFWSGCDPLGHIVDDLTSLYERLLQVERDAA